MSLDRTSELAQVAVVRTLGGCGGTLVARVLSAIPGVVVLSETNPRSTQLYAGMLNPIEQVRKWHPPLLAAVAGFDPGEIGFPPRFGALIEELLRAAAAADRTLVVRDFNYIDFIGVPFVWPVPGDLSLDVALDRLVEPRDVVVVRHPADQLASLRSHSAIAPVLRAQRFLEASMAFLAATHAAPRFRYEDLIAAPAHWFGALTTHLKLPWDPAALTEFAAVASVTGNLQRQEQTAIRANARSAAADQAERELAGLCGYRELLSTLGYDY